MNVFDWCKMVFFSLIALFPPVVSWWRRNQTRGRGWLNQSITTLFAEQPLVFSTLKVATWKKWLFQELASGVKSENATKNKIKTLWVPFVSLKQMANSHFLTVLTLSHHHILLKERVPLKFLSNVGNYFLVEQFINVCWDLLRRLENVLFPY